MNLVKESTLSKGSPSIKESKITKIETRKPLLIKRKKVAAYARVSVDTDRLDHSFSQQVSYYNKYINSNPKWEFAGVFSDCGITGTKINQRNGFKDMIKQAEDGKIDIILTKSISRFARNTVDLLKTVRHLKDIGVEVRFEKENINSMTADGELMLSVLSSFAQSESESISQNIKWSIKKRFEKGKSYTKQGAFGYKWVGDKMQIVESEAKIVRFIFNSYVNGMSRKEICRQLKDKRTRRGKKYLDPTIIYILRNSLYTGDLELQKYYVVDPITKKEKRNNGELDKYLIKNHHEPIISHKVFDKAQKMYEEVKEKRCYNYKYIKTYEFTGKIRCGNCGRIFVRRKSKRKPGTRYKTKDYIFYQCYSRHGGGNLKSCHNVSIRHDTLKELTKGIDVKSIVVYEDNRIVINDTIEKTWENNKYNHWTKERRERVKKECEKRHKQMSNK